MIWGCLSANVNPKLAQIEWTLGSMGYCTLLENILLQFAEDKYPEGCIFQQDNSQIHTSNHTKQLFSDMKIDTKNWPARSFDLNLIENLCGYMVTKV